MQKSKIALLSLAGCATIAAFSACKNTSNDNETKTADTTVKTTTAAPVKHNSVADDSLFVKDESGLDYKWVTHGTGTKMAVLGDVLEFRIIFKVGDSVLANSDRQNDGKPVSQKLEAPKIKGDLIQGLAKMKAGDSAVFRMLVDTMAARTHQPLAPWTKSGDYVVWEVKVESIKTKAEMLADIAKANKPQNDIDDKKIQDYFKAHNIKGAKKTAEGIYYTISKSGTGAHPTDGQQATVNYTGQNLKGEKFDSNVDPTFHHVGPFDFVIGQGVIEGWSLAVPLMNKGMKATFYIPSSLAYGAQAKDAKIGANEVLIFDIELVGFK